MSRIAKACCAVALGVLASCGGGTAVRVYRGTITDQYTLGGTANTDTYQNRAVYVIQDAQDPSQWTFYIPADTPVANATLSGDALNFIPGGRSETNSAGGSASKNLTNGTGRMAPDTLQFTINTATTGAQTYNDTIMFNGQRQ